MAAHGIWLRGTGMTTRRSGGRPTQEQITDDDSARGGHARCDSHFHRRGQGEQSPGAGRPRGSQAPDRRAAERVLELRYQLYFDEREIDDDIEAEFSSVH